jgi:hypothetical protein
MADGIGYSPLDIQGAVGFANSVVPDYARQQLLQRQAAVNERTIAMQQQQEARLTAAQQAKNAALAQQQQQVEELLRDPSPTNMFNYAMRNPGVANEAKATWDTMDTATRKAKFQEASEIYTLGLRDPKAAAAALRARHNPGDPQDEDDEAMAALLEGDEASVKRAWALMNIHTMAASDDPEKFAAEASKFWKPAYKEVGDVIVDENTGEAFLGPYQKVTPGPAGFYPHETPPGFRILGGGTALAPAAAAPDGGGAPAGPGEVVGTTPGGTPVTGGQDNNTGLKIVTSDRWKPGTVAYVTRSQQEYAKVPNGAFYIDPKGNFRGPKGGGAK